MEPKNSNKMNIKYIEKFNYDSVHDLKLINKKILKGIDSAIIDEDLINRVFSSNTVNGIKFLFFVYLLVDDYLTDEDYPLLREKLCDSNTWGRAKLNANEIINLMNIYKILNKDNGLYECDENGIRYIDKIEQFLMEDNGLNKGELKTLGFHYLKKEIYSNKIGNYFEELLKLDETQLKDKIIDIFDDVNCTFSNSKENIFYINFLALCQAIEDIELSMKYTKIFLEMGVDPNRLFYNLVYNERNYCSFVRLGIRKRKDINDIYEFLVECLKYNFDVTSNYNGIFDDMLDADISPSDILKVYKLLLNNNLNNREFFKKQTFIGLHKDKTGILSNNIYFINILHLINKEFKEINYEVELDYNDFIFENSHNLYDLYTFVKALISNEYTDKYVELICKTIIENRNNCMNVVDKKISVSEIIECFQTIKNNKKTEIDLGFNDISEKVLTYKN